MLIGDFAWVEASEAFGFAEVTACCFTVGVSGTVDLLEVAVDAIFGDGAIAAIFEVGRTVFRCFTDGEVALHFAAIWAVGIDELIVDAIDFFAGLALIFPVGGAGLWDGATDGFSFFHFATIRARL